MVIKIATDEQTYFNIREKFVNTVSKPKKLVIGNDAPFKKWLKQHGGRVENHTSYSAGDICCDTIGIFVGYDTIIFDNDKDAAWFLLKWS